MREGRPHYCSIQPAKLTDLGVAPEYAQFNGLIPTKATKPIKPPSTAPPTAENLSSTYSSIVGETGLVFFDLETREGENGELTPFVCVAFFMCSRCCFSAHMEPEKWKEDYPCCGRRIRRFVGLNEITDFVRILFFELKRFKRVHAFAFNGSGFDFIFILHILMSNQKVPEILPCGRRIIWLKLRNVILKDLMAYIPGTLSMLPETFQFSNKVFKGFFPHKLSNLVDNNFTSDHWPHIKFYEPHNLRSDAERKELLEFLASKVGQEFDFMRECLQYCDQDVLILTLAVLALELATLLGTKFHISFIHSTSFTIAGLSSVYYRHLFMKENSIGLYPLHGYANLTNVQSLAAEIFFRHCNGKRRAEGLEEIRYSKSSIYGEFKLATLRVDGVTSTEMWEYDSCFHHASPCCFKGRMTQIHPIYKVTYRQVHYLDRMRKLRLLQANPGKKLHVIHHCEVMKMLKADADFKNFFDKEKALSSTTRQVNVRDALFGGRVENLAVVVELTPSEIARGVKIDLVDVVSEYPYVQFVKPFPANLHPTYIRRDELPRQGSNMTLAEAEEYFGILSVFLLPPKNCMFPTVPFRSGANKGKTLYGLCRTCMEAGEQRLCRHRKESERGWQATLNSPDLEQALKDGFKILQCYEVYDWGADKTTTTLFDDMIRHLIKGKVQSKVGVENDSADKRRNMVEAWKRKINVQLDAENWKGNPALYQFYKVLLNSLWGKLAQNQVRRQTKFVKCWKEFETILENETTDLVSVQSTLSDILICVTANIDEHTSQDPAFYNPFIATLVASYARLHITSFMRPIGYGSPYYLDTDSLIYKSDPGYTNDPPVDPNKVLGSLVSELPVGTFIKVIVVIQPHDPALLTTNSFSEAGDPCAQELRL
jgi:hypothetical protein